MHDRSLWPFSADRSIPSLISEVLPFLDSDKVVDTFSKLTRIKTGQALLRGDLDSQEISGHARWHVKDMAALHKFRRMPE